MKKIKSIALALSMIVAGTANSFSQEHQHESSAHGGQIQDANGYHIELLNKNGKVSVYLLDNNAKAMSNKGITGSVILQFADKTSATVALTPSGDDGFSVNKDKAGTFKSCVVTFKVNGKTATAKFKAEKTVAKTYTCPMHAEVISDKQGKCPKCGMDLVEKKAEKKTEEHKHKEGEEHHH